MHKGMLWVRDVPGFEYILIHTGNTDEHTAGCLIVGDSQQNNTIKSDGFVGHLLKRTKEFILRLPKLLSKVKR